MTDDYLFYENDSDDIPDNFPPDDAPLDDAPLRTVPPDDSLPDDAPLDDWEPQGAGEVATGSVAPETDAPESPEPPEPPVPLRERVPRPVIRLTRIDALFYALLVGILAVGGWLRFDAQNWDDYTHLHPDERFLTDVVTLMGGPLQFTDDTEAEREAHRVRCEQRYPAVVTEDTFRAAGVGGYFDAECSPLNPNNLGKGLYVYGEFPLFTVHAAGVARSQFSRDYHTFLETFDPAAALEHTVTTHWEGYSGVQLIGRSISALADWFTILVLFLLGRRLYGRWTGLLAAALYAVAAFPIQQSHFWTVDAFTTLWVTLTLYFAVRAMDGASALGGPLVLAYLGLWAGAVAWETGYFEHPVLGLASLGVIFLVVLGLTAAIRRMLESMGLTWGGVLVAASGLLASVIYLVAWGVLILAAPRDFPLDDGLIKLGIAALLFGLAVLVAYIAAVLVRRQQIRQQTGQGGQSANEIVLGAVVLVYLALIVGAAVGSLSPWATLLIGLAATGLIIFDVTELTDYALFGVALGCAVSSRINIAPLAIMIAFAAAIRLLPALDANIDRTQRNRLIAYAMTGVMVAALLSLVVFRLLQPHAFNGPGFFGLKFNPGWRDDINESAYLTSGNWDAPPNHQWTSRTPYWFPWRNIVLWGLGIPLGLTAWIAWAWAGVQIARGRGRWTRHALPFLWVLLIFGWLGGRWVATMRYFLPLYPFLALFAAWALVSLVAAARRARADRRAVPRLPAFAGRAAPAARLAVGGAVTLLIVVLGCTALYGFGFHQIQREQLTRVAASRWFQETVPGDFGVWVEGNNGTRQMVNLGRGYVSGAPNVYRLEQGESVEILFTTQAEAVLDQIRLYRVGDAGRDPGEEAVRIRVMRDDLALGRQVIYEDTVYADLNVTGSPYGTEIVLTPPEPVVLQYAVDPNSLAVQNHVLEITALDGGPVMLVRDVTDINGMVISNMALAVRDAATQTPSIVDLNVLTRPLLTGHGDDIPDTPTHWTVGGSDPMPFVIPIDGEIRTLEIPHLGDPLRDDDAERVRLTLTAPGGEQTSVVIEADFNAGADPLGPPRTVTFDPPLKVRRGGELATLTVEAFDPVYTSGPVIAWEGDWDDPVPWPVCPLPDDMVYRDDLPSGLSAYTCGSVGMYGAFYQGIKLWMVAEDNEQKYRAMTNALDQADYIVITSNRFYDSLSRIPMRWPMTEAYYDALFDGRLGFELVKTFESYPSIGPFTLPDQILPTGDLPDWLNEHWEAEEAFHVYDHPVVMVFQKTDAYSPENTRAILDSVSIRPANTVMGGFYADPEPVGVVSWGAKQASEAPTLIELTDDKWATQRAGGTWAELFGSSLNDHQVVAVIVWWLLIMVAGWIAWPLLFVMFPALPDRAYPAAKITGWLIVAWVAWVGGTLNLRIWNRAGIAVLLVGLAALSGALIWQRRAEFAQYIRANWRHLLALEVLMLVLFLFLIGVRLGNPDLWHTHFGGEKPMDFAYFNGVLRSTVFPPYDPWNSGGYINYYYFGYVIVGAPVKLLGIAPSIAYNLIIPTLYAMTGGGVFSVAYNWVRARKVAPGAVVGATRDEQPYPLTPSPLYGEGETITESPDSVGALLAAPPVDDDEAPKFIDAQLAPPPDPLPASREGESWWASSPLSASEAQGGGDLGEGLTGDDAETPAATESPLPAGSAWIAGLLALLLALVLGNLGTLHVLVTGVASMPDANGQPRWSQPALYHQVRLAEAEARRTQIYDDFYQEELRDFRKKHGRDPGAGDENMDLIRAATERTDIYIDNYANHPPVYKLWEYEFTNLRHQISAFFAGLGDVLDGKPLPMATHRWHWGPTRIITELPNGAGRGAIAEMPYFTFLYGDLHAHMIAFPITLLVLVWLLSEIIGAGHHLRRWWESGAALILGALAVGVLRPTNSWDWITYLILGGAGLTYVAWVGASRAAATRPPSEAAARVWSWVGPERGGEWWPLLFAVPLGIAARVGYYFLRRMQADQQATRPLQIGETLIDPSLSLSSALVWGAAAVVVVIGLYIALLIVLRARITKSVLVDWLGRVGLFVGLTFVVGMPFTRYFATAYNKIKPWESDTTPLWAYLYVHGTFIFLVASFLIWQTARWLRTTRVRDLEGLALPVLVVGGGPLVVVLGALVYGVRDVAVAQLVVPLIVWATVLFFLPRQHALMRALYAIIVLALAITLGVEIVVLDGDIGRQNTVFKFYLQAWFLLSITGGVGLAWMLRCSDRWGGAVRAVWQFGLAILLTLGLMYPLLATQARFKDRFSEDVPLTLDGIAYMQYAVHGESGLYWRLEGDYDMIRWLEENVKGTPVVMEGRYIPSEYHWGGRIAINTGLPTILGWRFHQIQQHSLPDMDKLIQVRENNVSAFYELSGPEGIRAAMRLIDHYQIEYIIVGAFERAVYDDIVQDIDTGAQTVGHSPGIAKFDTMVELGLLEVVYDVPRCTDMVVEWIEDCPALQVYYDRVYHVVPGAEVPEDDLILKPVS